MARLAWPCVECGGERMRTSLSSLSLCKCLIETVRGTAGFGKI